MHLFKNWTRQILLLSPPEKSILEREIDEGIPEVLIPLSLEPICISVIHFLKISVHTKKMNSLKAADMVLSKLHVKNV